MERRYLVAALAIIATFAGLSRGFRSLEALSLRHSHDWAVMAKARCNAAPVVASQYPEEAQLLAEMNVPIGSVEAKLAEQMARQQVAAAECARAKALREADKARREALKMRQDLARTYVVRPVTPMSLEITLPDMNQIQRNAARMAAQQVKLQMAANRLQASIPVMDSELTSATAEQTMSDNGVHVHCNVTTSWQRQAQHSAREAARQAIRQLEDSLRDQ